MTLYLDLKTAFIQSVHISHTYLSEQVVKILAFSKLYSSFALKAFNVCMRYVIKLIYDYYCFDFIARK